MLGYKRTRDAEKWFAIFIFLIPSVILYAWLVIVPVLRAVQFSMYKWNGLGPLTDFIGLDNFVTIFNDKIFIQAIGNNFFIIILSLLVQLPVALALAVVLQRKLPGRAAFRTIFFMPFVVSEVITGILFSYIFRPLSTGGLVNTILDWFGISGPPWLAEPDLVMYAIFVTLSWKFFGYHMVLYLAGLQSIPAELEEAAMIDGASGWGIFRHVTLPLLGPTIRLTIYLSVIGSLQTFDLIWAMTRGGPVMASETMATYMYRSGFLRQQLGYGSALAIIIFILALIFSLIFQRYAMRRDLEGAY
jgi:raffinose/stachyose/melibiose transport system permease protein